MTENQNDRVVKVEKDGDPFVKHAPSFSDFVDWYVKIKPHDPDTADAALRDLVEGYVVYGAGEPWRQTLTTRQIIQTVMDLFPLIKTLPTDMVSDIIVCYLHGRFAPVTADYPDFDKTIFEWYESKRIEWEEGNF